MLKREKKKCINCGKIDFWFSKKQCKSCSVKPISKVSSMIKRVRTVTQEKKKFDSDVKNLYFDYHIEHCKFSEESYKTISDPTRANICHLFPKRTYKSIQGNLNNCVYLTLEEHTRFDYLLDSYNFSTLEKEFRCWPKVVDRMNNLLPSIKENGKLLVKFQDYLLSLQKN